MKRGTLSKFRVHFAHLPQKGVPDSMLRTGRRFPAHPSSPKVKAKGSSHQQKQEEETKDEEREVSCSRRPQGSPERWAPTEREQDLNRDTHTPHTGSQLEGRLATLPYLQTMKPREFKGLVQGHSANSWWKWVRP